MQNIEYFVGVGEVVYLSVLCSISCVIVKFCEDEGEDQDDVGWVISNDDVGGEVGI